MPTAAGLSEKDDEYSLDVPDPSGLPPLCSEEKFAEMVAGMVADNAPRLFAIVAEYGDRVDAKCAAWGMAFEDCVYAVDVPSNGLHIAQTVESVLRRFRVSAHVTPRLVWANPDTDAPLKTEE